MSRLAFCVVCLSLLAGTTEAIGQPEPVVAVFFTARGQDPANPRIGMNQLDEMLARLFHEHSYASEVYPWHVDLQIPDHFIFGFPEERWVILAGSFNGASAVTALSLNMWIEHDLMQWYDDAVVTYEAFMGIGGVPFLAPGPERGENYYCSSRVDIDCMESIDVGAEYGVSSADRSPLVHALAANFIVHRYVDQAVSRSRWQSAAPSGNWATPANWDTGSPPSSDSIATLFNTSLPTGQEAVVTADDTVSVVEIRGSAGVMNVVVQSGATLTADIGLVAGNNGCIELQAGTIATMGLDLTNGLLFGIGTLDGDLDNAGTVAPGSSAGILAITGDYTQDATGTLQIELGGLTPGSEYDRLDVAGSFAAAGTLDITLIDLGGGPFNPQLGNTFDVFDFADASGSFDAVNLPNLSGGLRWETSALLASGELSVIPEPSTLVLLSMGVVALLACAWRNRRHQ